MTQRKSGLGKNNLDVFLSKSSIVAKKIPSDAGKPSQDLLHLPIGNIQPDPQQPRRQITPAALAELTASIKHQGLIQPIVVRPLTDDKFEIIAGERRWRAAQQAGLKSVPVVVRSDLNEQQRLVMALVENLQREDLNLIDEAQGFARLIEEFDLTHQAVAEMVGKSRAAVSNSLRLLQLHPAVQQLLQERRLDMGHTRALLPLPTSEQQDWAAKILAQGLTVRETEAAIQALAQPGKKVSAQSGHQQQVAKLRQQQLAQKLSQSVSVKPNLRRGGYSVQLYCHSLEDLDELISNLS